MENVQITVTANASGTLQDFLGMQVYDKTALWPSQPFVMGQTVTFEVPAGVWPRIRPLLDSLAQRRIPALDPTTGTALGTGKTMPMLSYTIEQVPGSRPRIHQVENTNISLAAPANVVLRGENLIGGVAASSTVEIFPASSVYAAPGTRSYARGVKVLKVTAVAKGPVGNLITYEIKEASGGGSVAITLGADGAVHIAVTPAAGASNSTAIAAQFNASASVWVTATALVASQPIPATRSIVSLTGIRPPGIGDSASFAGLTDRVALKGGDGGGLAVLDVPVTTGSAANRLRVLANKAGNDGNNITLTLLASQGADSVVVTGTNIVVSRIAATTAIGTLVTAINGNANAAALVTASSVGAGSLGALSKSWLAGGAGEPVVAKIGGATTTVAAQSDTSMTLTTTNAALVAASVAAGEIAAIQIQMAGRLVQAQVPVVA